MDVAVAKVVVRQKALYNRAMMLARIASELRPQLSLAEQCNLRDLKTLATQTMRASTHIGIEKHCVNTCSYKIGKSHFPDFDGSQLRLAKQLLSDQTRFFCIAGTKVSKIRATQGE